ncbi:MAG: hypothetical protein JW873_03230 [Candidatus Saganbacteria bacterium]|nr:hypothetical protein [Candidatus Saganbacteria bacterium]
MLTKNGKTFFCNITTEHEVLGNIRTALLKDWAKKEGLFNGKKLQRNQIESRIICPALKNGKRADLIRHLKTNISVEINRVNLLFPYLSWNAISGPANRGRLSVNNLIEYMGEYLFDSSDAMIANFSLSSSHTNGIVTCDKAFIRLKDEEEIYLPEKNLKAYKRMAGA